MVFHAFINHYRQRVPFCFGLSSALQVLTLSKPMAEVKTNAPWSAKTLRNPYLVQYDTYNKSHPRFIIVYPYFSVWIQKIIIPYSESKTGNIKF